MGCLFCWVVAQSRPLLPLCRLLLLLYRGEGGRGAGGDFMSYFSTKNKEVIETNVTNQNGTFCNFVGYCCTEAAFMNVQFC